MEMRAMIPSQRKAPTISNIEYILQSKSDYEDLDNECDTDTYNGNENEDDNAKNIFKYVLLRGSYDEMVQLDSGNVNCSSRFGNEIDAPLNTQATSDYVLLSLVDPLADESVYNNFTKLDQKIENIHKKAMKIIQNNELLEKNQFT